jgi:hypothetical protein
MSSSDGFEMLKKWQIANSIVKTLPGMVSEQQLDASSPKEVSVRVAGLGDSYLLLEVVGSGRMVSFDVKDAEFLLATYGAVSTVDIKTPTTRITIYGYDR